ncbi:beta-class carbonic anhydrase [Alkalihalobacterium chitinilyticum]|uniref:carbonic anhydrase n=1 Tax=Alkalihalobacterium chitinilyticum TaxID=2980103 RepID=A0ABT5VJQ7_9BACI|nr:carbonic anhydrase [Alkalihalobacterium chitinilyticum]MDE5415683.1 carbonic anhydrase [Alkalihalobacterium chitinilyticum]
MALLQTILDYNETFVREKKYEEYQTTKFPNKKLVVLTCMDTRLTELLPRAMNLKNGDAKIIKNAGAFISHPFGSIMRSIIVALYELKAQEVCVIGHHGCGMAGLESSSVLAKAEECGVSMEKVETIAFAGINVNEWLKGFSKVEESVMHSVEMVRKHPLLPPETPVHGLVICPETGKLDIISDGYQSS